MKIAKVYIGHVSGSTNEACHTSDVCGKIMSMSIDVAFKCEPLSIPLTWSIIYGRNPDEASRHP